MFRVECNRSAQPPFILMGGIWLSSLDNALNTPLDLLKMLQSTLKHGMFLDFPPPFKHNKEENV